MKDLAKWVPRELGNLVRGFSQFVEIHSRPGRFSRQSHPPRVLATTGHVGRSPRCSATVGARIRSSSDLRLRIHAHPDAYQAPRALVTIPIRQVRMGAGFVPLQKIKHRTDHHP
jgi:hypothetical protein